ncbi:hypothetical protein LPN04_29980 [Rugamonas sp. A1-17]|nr:hypothetical protein [Rugamonas sp. A1-17]
MHHSELTCPSVGHKTFEKSLQTITLGDTCKPNQITKFIRPRSCTIDSLLMEYPPGELQKLDFVEALGMFDYPRFITATLQQHASLFADSQCRIYQFQTLTSSGANFVFGMFITDGANNLVDLCIDSSQATKRKPILMRLIRAICSPTSVAKKLSH